MHDSKQVYNNQQGLNDQVNITTKALSNDLIFDNFQTGSVFS